jgi:predicted O-methyltransferase YrrM
MELINPLVSAYAEQYASALDAIAAEVERHTMEHHPHAHMISGHVQGKFLEMLSLMIRPSRILEIGSFTGFSALCLAKGLSPEGKLHTIEIREQDAAVARVFFGRAGMDDRIVLHEGRAMDVLRGLRECWDLVFLDADKTSYIDYYELTLPDVRPGGWLLADNVLFHGEVLSELPKGKNAIAIQAFNDHVRKDPRVETVLLTVRDGLMLIRKK